MIKDKGLDKKFQEIQEKPGGIKVNIYKFVL